MSFINITSEIGKLNKVMLHRPGGEVENLIPEYLGRLLFDDIPYLADAQAEHDNFAKILRDNGTEVVYLEEMTAEALYNNEMKEAFLNDVLDESGIKSPALRDAITDFLFAMSTREMVDKVMAGIRKDEINFTSTASLADMMSDDYPFYLDPMPNLYFTRDPGAAVGNGLILNVMQTEARRRETLCLKYVQKFLTEVKGEDIPLWYNRTEDFSSEGGDELVLSDKVLAIGCSERTSPQAIQTIAQNLFNSDNNFEKVLAFDIPNCRAFMHLDTVFTMVDYDKFTIHPGIEGPLSVYELTKGANGAVNIAHNTNPLEKTLANALNIDNVELIRCGGGDRIIAGREQWNDGSNTLTIAPGVVITYDRNYVSNELLEKSGVKVLSMRGSELVRGRGGPRCMSMPLHRDNITF